MGTIKEKKLKNGECSYRTIIRTEQVEDYKTFTTREDAECYIKYKERLLINKENFNIHIENRVRLSDIVELKIKNIAEPRALSEFKIALERVVDNMKPHVFLSELTLKDWKDCMDKVALLEIPIRGNAITHRLISSFTLRRTFASLSSAFSHAVSLGIPVENYPLQVVQKYINPFMSKLDKLDDE